MLCCAVFLTVSLLLPLGHVRIRLIIAIHAHSSDHFFAPVITVPIASHSLTDPISKKDSKKGVSVEIEGDWELTTASRVSVRFGVRLR